MEIVATRNIQNTKFNSITGSDAVAWDDSNLTKAKLQYPDSINDIILTFKVFSCILSNRYDKALEYLKKFIDAEDSKSKNIIIKFNDDENPDNNRIIYPFFSIDEGKLAFAYRVDSRKNLNEIQKYDEWDEFSFNFIDNCSDDNVDGLIQRFHLFNDTYDEYIVKGSNHPVCKAMKYLKNLVIVDMDPSAEDPFFTSMKTLTSSGEWVEQTARWHAKELTEIMHCIGYDDFASGETKDLTFSYSYQGKVIAAESIKKEHPDYYDTIKKAAALSYSNFMCNFIFIDKALDVYVPLYTASNAESVLVIE